MEAQEDLGAEGVEREAVLMVCRQAVAMEAMEDLEEVEGTLSAAITVMLEE